MADLKALKNKTIITVAPTGAWPKKKDNPNVPMTPEEIAEDVYECWKAGAAIAHLHIVGVPNSRARANSEITV